MPLLHGISFDAAILKARLNRRTAEVYSKLHPAKQWDTVPNSPLLSVQIVDPT